MPIMNARVSTPDASRLINRLCKHFRHRIEAEWNERHGQLHFSIGECRLSAEPDALVLRCESPSTQQLDELGEVVASHLVRFAGDQVEAVQWQARAA